MDRRDFIKQTSAAAGAVAVGVGAGAAAAQSGVAAPAIVSGARELRMVMPWAQNGRGFDDSARRLAQWVQAATDGRFRVTIAADAGGLTALSSGAADIYHGSGHDFAGLNPAFAYFAGLPGAAGLRPTYLNAWLTAGGGQTLWDDLAVAHGFKPLLAGHSGARGKLWSRERVADAAALQGRRIAAFGLAAGVVRELGAVPVDVAAADLGAALADGRVDAVEWGGTIAGYASDLHGAARFCLRPGLTRNGFSSVLAVRSGVWDGLSAGDQAIFAAGAACELNAVVAENLAASRALRAGLAERHGVAFETLAPGVAEAARRAAEAVVAEMAASCPQARRINANHSAFRANLPGPRARPVRVA